MRLALVVSLLLLLAPYAIESSELKSSNLHPQGEFPHPPQSSTQHVERSPRTEQLFGQERGSPNFYATSILDGKCPSSNTLECSGHGKCTLSATSIFATSLSNVHHYVCECIHEWHGRGCHLEWTAKTLSETRKVLAKLFRSPKAGSRFARESSRSKQQNPEIKLDNELDSGSFMSRRDPNWRGAHVKGNVSAWTGVTRDRGAPANSKLDSWASPDQRHFVQGGSMIAQYLKAHAAEKYVDEFAERRRRYESVPLATKPTVVLRNMAGETIHVAPSDVYEPEMEKDRAHPFYGESAQTTTDKLLTVIDEIGGKLDEDGNPIRGIQHRYERPKPQDETPLNDYQSLEEYR